MIVRERNIERETEKGRGNERDQVDEKNRGDEKDQEDEIP
jgi:hypothetical protein